MEKATIILNTSTEELAENNVQKIASDMGRGYILASASLLLMVICALLQADIWINNIQYITLNNIYDLDLEYITTIFYVGLVGFILGIVYIIVQTRKMKDLFINIPIDP